MAVVVGTDEAGYGPNLGPLVVGASLWEVPDDLLTSDLYEVLADAVCRDPSRETTGASPEHVHAEVDRRPLRVSIADSKVLYRPGDGLSRLEGSVLAAGMASDHWPRILNSSSHNDDQRQPCEHGPATWQQLMECVGALDWEGGQACPWHADDPGLIPVATERAAWQTPTNRLRQVMSAEGVRLIHIACRVVFPAAWNELLDRTGSKGEALSCLTLGLAADLTRHFPEGTVGVVLHCDKHGGRNRYAALLQHAFPDAWVQIDDEGRHASHYHWQTDRQHWQARFVARGESFLPSALASMVAKYVREVSMSVFNRFWGQHVPDLKPTAGYPVDAKRFRRDIAEAQRRLHITDRVLWRNR